MHSTCEMDEVPQDSGCYSTSFDTSALFPSTPIKGSRKRKRDGESLVPSPQFSSTFNESLLDNFRNLDVKHASYPNTPDKKFVGAAVAASPIEESRKILYGHIKHVRPKAASPRVTKRRSDVFLDKRDSFKKVLGNHVIMDCILGYLSGGDLYRLSMVSRLCNNAILECGAAYQRLELYRSVYRDNKENYVITPPASPEKSPSPPVTTSENFNTYIRAAKKLTRQQSLARCRKCDKLAVVENDVCQCQNMSACGLIYCLRCSSYSETGPKDFTDKCGHSQLRTKLGNVSNNMDESFYGNTFNFSGNTFNFSSQDSGFQSESESPLKVKRNLFGQLNDSKGALAAHNRNTASGSQLGRQRAPVLEVVVVQDKDGRRKTLEECGDSPPRKDYAVGSKQSKRNLKRLTR